jgi:hypothetical protein
MMTEEQKRAGALAIAEVVRDALRCDGEEQVRPDITALKQLAEDAGSAIAAGIQKLNEAG